MKKISVEEIFQHNSVEVGVKGRWGGGRGEVGGVTVWWE